MTNITALDTFTNTNSQAALEGLACEEFSLIRDISRNSDLVHVVRGLKVSSTCKEVSLM